MNRIKGKTVRNTRTGEIGTVTGKWRNPWTNQTVVSVRVDSTNQPASWNARQIGKAAI